MLFKAPGRIEICGNHTDHQHGSVLTAAVDSYIYGEAEPNNSNIISIHSEDYPDIIIKIQETEPRESERGTSAALVRGMIAAFEKSSYNIGGFNVSITSELPSGAGLASSAAYEVLIGRIINTLFCEGELSEIDIAKAGQYAESIYYGKPCGLMDQMACSVGGFTYTDFSDIENPVVKKLKNNPTKQGFCMCLVNTGDDHIDLTEDYASIPYEMSKVAAIFAKKYLVDVPEKDFLSHIRFVRDQVGDRAALRAIHFFDENRRVKNQVSALNTGNLDLFFKLTNESGISSWTLLQNVTPMSDTKHQEMAYALTVCSHALKGQGAVRIHGGGFAGSVLVWVPKDLFDSFNDEVTSRLGKDRISVLTISE